MNRAAHRWMMVGLIAATSVAVTTFAPPAVCAQTSAAPKRAAALGSHDTSGFAPLDEWKAAVVAGDEHALAGFYVPLSANQQKPSQGDIRDPSGEPVFWGSLKSGGLNQFNFKVLEVDRPRPDLMGFVFRCDIKLHNASGDFADVINGLLVWMKRPEGWKIVETQRGDLTPFVARRLPEPAKPNTQLYPAPALATREIAEALQVARADHKRVMLVFGGNWCYDCHVLDATFHSKDIAPLVQQNYHVVHINIGNYDQNVDLAKRYEIPLEKGVPSLAILDSTGKLLVSQRQGDFENTVRIGPEDVTQFLEKWKPEKWKP